MDLKKLGLLTLITGAILSMICRVLLMPVLPTSMKRLIRRTRATREPDWPPRAEYGNRVYQSGRHDAL